MGIPRKEKGVSALLIPGSWMSGERSLLDGMGGAVRERTRRGYGEAILKAAIRVTAHPSCPLWAPNGEGPITSLSSNLSFNHSFSVILGAFSLL